jgi:hypothetical protein
MYNPDPNPHKEGPWERCMGGRYTEVGRWMDRRLDASWPLEEIGKMAQFDKT